MAPVQSRLVGDPEHGPSGRRAQTRHPRTRRWWQFTAAEARTPAWLAAGLLWTTAAVVAFAGPGYRSIFGPLKGGDFVQFYTLGHIDAQLAPAILYNAEAFHGLQTQLVPESQPERYLPVYPPHAALLFRPLAGMPYGTAALMWAAILVLGYAGCLWLAWRPVRATLNDRRLLIAAAAAFPPFWYLVLHGQTTIVPLVGFCLGWVALEHRRPFWAGMALGLLSLKPQFALVLVPLVLTCREWAMLAGAAVSVSLHVLAIVAWLGSSSVLWDYAALAVRLLALPDALSPRPDQMHSISALTSQLPGAWDIVVWALLSALVIAGTIHVWQSSATVAVRTGILVLASTLVNPHVFVYDAAVLAPAFLWLAAWIYGGSGPAAAARSWFGGILSGLYLTFLAPTAAFLPVQTSVVLLGALFVLIVGTLASSERAIHAMWKSGPNQPFRHPTA